MTPQLEKLLMKYILNIIVTCLIAIPTFFSSVNAATFDDSEWLPLYDGSTHYNIVQQSTNETMDEFYIASNIAKHEGLKSFHDFALDITVNHISAYGTQYVFDSEKYVLYTERPEMFPQVVQITLSEYQVALYQCHDLWVRSDSYKRSYIEYINAQL